ncbi:hypothetical protein ACE6H2_002138 [Prunus campanulata]
MLQTTPVLLLSVEMLRHGVEVYTPDVFKLFQEEYKRILDYNIYKVGKSEMTTEYKVSYIGKSQEHLVKFEASTEKVNCSCLKFMFVGILCAHAMKVLDKKNVKRIPSQYILNRWRRDAKAKSITSYNGFGIHDNPKESMGKRYNHLCRNFREIASFAAEHEKLTEYVDQCSIEMLKGLEEIKTNLFCGNQHVDRVVEQTNSATPIVIGVKRKATVGRPRNRLKDPLERKRQKTSTKASARRQIKMQEIDFASGGSQVQQIVGHEEPCMENGTYMPFSTVESSNMMTSW